MQGPYKFAKKLFDEKKGAGGVKRGRSESIKMAPDTMKIFGRDMSWAVIPPDSSWKSKWDYLIIIFVLYDIL